MMNNNKKSQFLMYVPGFFFQLTICTPPFLRSGYIYLEDAQCADMNEKSIFLFLFFELWSIMVTIFKSFDLNNRPQMIKKEMLSFKSGHIYMKYAQCAQTKEKSIFQSMRFSVFKCGRLKFNKLAKKNSSQKMHDALKRIFQLISFFCCDF